MTIMDSAPRINVVGLGLAPEHLGPAAREVIDAAQALVGGRPQLELFAGHPAEKIVITSPVSVVIAAIEERLALGVRVVALADGDPLLFGFGATLAQQLGRERLRVLPNIGAAQAAAARLALPWHDMRVVSLHGRGDLSPLFAGLTHAAVTAVYTDATNSPAAIGRAMLERGAVGFVLHVFEHLCQSNERARRLTPEDAAKARFREPNIVLVERLAPPPVRLRLGIGEDELLHEAGCVTKNSLRAAGLAGLELAPTDTLWDLGAGSGSVSIEAARLLTHGRALAVEGSARRMDMLRRNIARCGAFLVEPVHGTMPAALAGLPTPDAVFIGGGLSDRTVLETACDRLAPGGRLVAHIILLENLDTARRHLSHRLWPWELQQICVHRAEPLAGSVRLTQLNPVFVLTARRPG